MTELRQREIELIRFKIRVLEHTIKYSKEELDLLETQLFFLEESKERGLFDE